jgi:cell division protein FtsB
MAGTIWRAATTVPRRPQIPVIPLIVAGALLIVGFLALSTARNVVRHYQLREEERDLRAELRQLDADAEQLAAVRTYLESDEYIEDVARRVLGLVKPGETLVIVAGAQSAPTPAVAPSAGGPWWKKLFIAPAATPTPAEAGMTRH